ncbi:uncharacterized protein N0V89_008300 [Didymosphaeria variabile]|uniref:Uncharacterized protein n=1 Tax=Didymosphaeria variabile TaxID=1932322 RepID=A0A9W8XFZ3_9PLEO|nr:uncharacterized protein N0V89_008300 [Didymosphaeria variabile]KAJ4349683.1 hypothetical protein N0V89_008300 [Didymosphaeria variabile]
MINIALSAQVQPLKRLQELPASKNIRIHLLFYDFGMDRAGLQKYKNILEELGPLLYDMKAQNKVIKSTKCENRHRWAQLTRYEPQTKDNIMEARDLLGF